MEGSTIETDKGFPEKRSVEVLFEELFYNADMKPHRVLCVSGPLEGPSSVASKASTVDIFKEHHAVDEQLRWLRQHAMRGEAMNRCNRAIEEFNASYVLVKGFVDQTATKLRGIVTHCVESLCDESPVFAPCASNKRHKLVLIRAVQTYVLNGVQKRVMSGMKQMYVGEETTLNEVTAARRDITLKELGVDHRIPESVDLKEAIGHVKGITEDAMPLSRITALKSVLNDISHSVEMRVKGYALATDDLLPLLIVVLIRAAPTSLFCSTEYLKHFSSSDDTSDEWGFYVATLSAAVEYMHTQLKPSGASAPPSRQRGSSISLPQPRVPAAQPIAQPSARIEEPNRHETPDSKPTRSGGRGPSWSGGFYVKGEQNPRPEPTRQVSQPTPSTQAPDIAPAVIDAQMQKARAAIERSLEPNDDEGGLGDFLTSLRDSDDVVSGSLR